MARANALGGPKSVSVPWIRLPVILKQGESDMGDKGKRDKGRREQQKKAKVSPKDKRKAKQDKKNNRSPQRS
jgi:hypothetical protein